MTIGNDHDWLISLKRPRRRDFEHFHHKTIDFEIRKSPFLIRKVHLFASSCSSIGLLSWWVKARHEDNRVLFAG